MRATYPQSRDLVVVVLTEDAHAGESVLAELLDALVETSDKIASHEDLLQLPGVLASPDGEALSIEILPEEVDGNKCVIVRVAALEGVEHE